MTRLTKTPALAILAISTSVLAISTPAYGQVDEIIVTAQKKEQSLQDVPIAISALNLEGLEAARIEGIEELANAIPGVYVTQNPADANGVRVNIRGIGTLDPQLGQDSRIAVYQDGVYMGRTQGLALDLPDLQRMEVLKGPQGTLYGRNSVGGAINIISAGPEYGKTTGKVSAEYGNFDHKKISGAVNLPIGDKVAIRASGLFMERDGWVENLGPGTDFGGESKWGIRGAICFDVNEKLELQVSADHNITRKEPRFYQSTTDFGAGFLASAITPFDGRQEEVTTSFAPEKGRAEASGISGVVNYDAGENHDVKLTVAYRELDSRRFVSLIPTANPDILDQIAGGFNTALGLIPGAYETGNSLFADPGSQFFDPNFPGLSVRPDFGARFAGAPNQRGLFLSDPGGAATISDHEQFSAEVTYNGSVGDGKFDYTLGAFYFNEDTGTGPTFPAAGNTNEYLFALNAFQYNPSVQWQRDVQNRLFPFRNFLPEPNRSLLSDTHADGTPNLTTGVSPLEAALIFDGFANAGFARLVANPLRSLLYGTPGDPSNEGQCFAETAQTSGTGVGPDGIAGTADDITIIGNDVSSSLFCEYSALRNSTGAELYIQTDALAAYGQVTWNVTDNLRVTGGLRFSNESRDGQQQPKSLFFGDNFDSFGNPIAPNVASISDNIIDPALTIEYDADDDVLLYASYKQAYRAGGFNSSAVAIPRAGETIASDFLFGREDITAYEAGVKSRIDEDFQLNFAAYYYDFKNKQATAGDPRSSVIRTVVNTDEEIWGFDVDAVMSINDYFTLNGGYSYIDGNAGDVLNPFTGLLDVRDEIQGTPSNSYVASLNYSNSFGDDGRMFANLSYSYKDEILAIPQGRVRLPSFGIATGQFGISFPNSATVTVWGTNLFDEKYLIEALNFEGFAYRTQVFGQPRSYGITVAKKF